ncbi:hypothetical protein FIBSPDRAFT_152408, partial [Athelia psychrophila]
MLLSATTTNPTDWRYVSEGGANIVFSFIGDPHLHPSFQGKVLRLCKIPRTSLGSPAFPDKNELALRFYRTVIENIIPLKNLPKLTAFTVDRDWLQALADVHESGRPPARTRIDSIDVTRTSALMATDLVGQSTFSVEIKPKWGFLPSPTHLAIDTLPVKMRTCRFCRHEYLRSSQKGTTSLTQYCPLDLYSGDAHRIEKAIGDLWDGWVATGGTGNNLKIFLHGKLIKPGESMGLLQTQLDVGNDMGLLRDKFVATLLPLLVNTTVLHTLSKLQRTLDPLDIEGLSLLWNNSQSNTDDSVLSLGSKSTQPSIEEWSLFIERYLSPDRPLDHKNPDSANLRYYILAYLLSTTFKDCSIMLSVGSENDPGDDPVRVIDLDVKDINRFGKWRALDQEIVEACRCVVHMQYCIDSDTLNNLYD